MYARSWRTKISSSWKTEIMTCFVASIEVNLKRFRRSVLNKKCSCECNVVLGIFWYPQFDFKAGRCSCEYSVVLRILWYRPYSLVSGIWSQGDPCMHYCNWNIDLHIEAWFEEAQEREKRLTGDLLRHSTTVNRYWYWISGRNSLRRGELSYPCPGNPNQCVYTCSYGLICPRGYIRVTRIILVLRL